jgi:hypothetical protein
VLLSIAALVMMQLGLAWEGGCGEVSPSWDAAIGVALPWLAGHTGFAVLSLRSAGLALAFALAWGAGWRADTRSGRRLGIGAQLLAMLLLVALRQPLAAACIALLAVPQVAMLALVRRGQPAPWYVRHTRLWLMAAMLVAAWVL